MSRDRKALVAPPSDGDVAALLDSMGVSPCSNLIAVLQEVQDELGYLPADALEQISRRTKVRLSRVYGVVTFYTQFRTEPPARHTIRCCRGTACHVRGAKGVLDAVQKELGIRDGETTEDLMFHLETVACLGTCFLAPVMMIDEQYFGQLTAERAVAILRGYRDSGR